MIPEGLLGGNLAQVLGPYFEGGSCQIQGYDTLNSNKSFCWPRPSSTKARQPLPSSCCRDFWTIVQRGSGFRQA